MDGKTLALATCNIVLASGANLCLKFSIPENSFQLFTLAVMLNSASFTLLYLILKNSDLGSNQVIVSSGVIIVSCVNGKLLFGESFNGLKIVSILLAFSSIATMYVSNKMSYDEIPRAAEQA